MAWAFNNRLFGLVLQTEAHICYLCWGTHTSVWVWIHVSVDGGMPKTLLEVQIAIIPHQAFYAFMPPASSAPSHPEARWTTSTRLQFVLSVCSTICGI